MSFTSRSSNPVLTKILKKYQNRGSAYSSSAPFSKPGYFSNANAYGYNANPQYGSGAPNFGNGQAPTPSYETTRQIRPSERSITYDDIVAKTSISLAIVVISAVFDYLISSHNSALGVGLGFLGVFVGLITVLASSFRAMGAKGSSPAYTLIYAVAEGLFVGSLTWVFAYSLDLTSGFPWIAFQALLGTAGVFVAMLVMYRSRVIRVTPRFNKILFSSIIGVLFLSVGSALISMFTHKDILNGNGKMGLLFTCVIIVIAAFTLMSDFNDAEQLVNIGAPAVEAWGVSLSLLVTIIWLYTEVLRLLYILNSND